MSNDGTHLRVLGASGVGPVVILASGDLQAWEPILTNPPVIGAVEFIDPEAGNQAGRFYRAVEGAVAAIFDATDLSAGEYDDLRHLTTALHPAPVIALLAFPRSEDHRRALSAGAAAVVSKPLAVDDLFWELNAATSNGR